MNTKPIVDKTAKEFGGSADIGMLGVNRMKTTAHILTIGLLVFLFSCSQRNEQKNNSLIPRDSLQQKQVQKEKERLEKRKKIEEQEKIDSLRLEKVLKEALIVANQNINNDKFSYEYEVTPDSISVKVEITSGFFFTNTNPHLIIRRNEPSSINIDIYFRKGNTYEKVVSHKEWSLTYVNDTIRDINGDGLKDFVVNWYGATGCCLKAFSNVYLFRQNLKEFSNSFEFINPTFSPKEKIVRGVCYGHPGETEMYKFQWNRENVDTLEYVSYEKDDKGEKTGKILITSKAPHGKKFKVLKRLNNVPSEYKEIEGYDWFTGKGYE